MFHDLLPLMYDLDRAVPLPAAKPGRSQNHSVMISLLAARYAATGNVPDLDLAARLADWLIQNRRRQRLLPREQQDRHPLHLRPLHGQKHARTGRPGATARLPPTPCGGNATSRHFDSARRAIDNLLRRGDQVQTEGEQTFEDSMIANTSAQLGALCLAPAGSGPTRPVRRRRSPSSRTNIVVSASSPSPTAACTRRRRCAFGNPNTTC